MGVKTEPSSDEAFNNPSWEGKNSLQENSPDSTSESSDSTTDEDDADGMLRDFTHRWSKLLPDWSEYAVPRLDLPDSEKDLEERIRKELESHCSLCKIPKSKSVFPAVEYNDNPVNYFSRELSLPRSRCLGNSRKENILSRYFKENTDSFWFHKNIL